MSYFHSLTFSRSSSDILAHGRTLLSRQVEPITFRISAGKCALVGGLARIEVTGDSKPFLFTFFVANGVKLHLTDASRADDFTARHAGEMLVPPLAPGPERLAEIGEFEYHDITVRGDGWKTAAADIALRGLGWVAVTGAGTASVRIGVPRGVGVSVRPPLMPFDVWEGERDCRVCVARLGKVCSLILVSSCERSHRKVYGREGSAQERQVEERETPEGSWEKLIGKGLAKPRRHLSPPRHAPHPHHKFFEMLLLQQRFLQSSDMVYASRVMAINIILQM